MSTDTAAPVPAPERRRLTPAASNLLGWWWLAIVFGIVLLGAMWPSIFSSGEGSISTYVLWILGLALVGVGVWATIGFCQGDQSSTQIMRLTAMIGMGMMIAGVGYFLYSVAFASAPKAAGQEALSFFGPSGTFLGGILWTFLIILPLTFALLVIFGLMSDGVDEWFNPPPEETNPSLTIDPATAALMAGGAAASLTGTGEEAVMSELTEAMAVSKSRRKVADEDLSVEMIGSAQDDLSVEVIGDATAADTGTYEELAALEKALSEDMQQKKTKPVPANDDEPLKVDDDMKL